MKREIPPAPRTLAAALKVAIANGRTLLDAPHRHYVFAADRWDDGTDPARAACRLRRRHGDGAHPAHRPHRRGRAARIRQ